MIYGISKSKDNLLSNISEALDENIQKSNTINRLSDNLNKELSTSIDSNYIDIDTLGDTPMMLASNIQIKSKDDVTKIVRNYMNRWRIEESLKDIVFLWFYQLARGIKKYYQMREVT